MKKLTIFLLSLFLLCILCSCSTHKHSWDSGTLVTKPTLTTEGVMEYICTTCQKTKRVTTQKQTVVTPVWSDTNLIYNGQIQTVSLNFPSGLSDNISIEYSYNSKQYDGVLNVGNYIVTAEVTNNNPYVILNQTTFTTHVTVSQAQFSILSVSVKGNSVYWETNVKCSNITIKIIDNNGEVYLKDFDMSIAKTSDSTSIDSVSSNIPDGIIKAYVKINTTTEGTGTGFVESSEYNYIKGPHVTMEDSTSYRVDGITNDIIIHKVSHGTSKSVATQAKAYLAQGFTHAKVTFGLHVVQEGGITGPSNIRFWLDSGYSSPSSILSSYDIYNGGDLEATERMTIGQLNSIGETINIAFENTKTWRAAFVKYAYIKITYY